MGFIWSSPVSPLKESLLDTTPESLLRTGDILLVYASEFEITLNTEIWSHVGIIVQTEPLQVFCNGEFVYINDWLARYDKVVARHCHAIRPTGFDARIMNAANKTADILLKNEIDIQYKEGYCVGNVLGLIGLVEKDELYDGGLKPSHFSVHSPYERLTLKDYSEHMAV